MFPPSDPRTLRIEDFDYPLPDERIAKYPMAERDASRLLHYDAGHIADRTFCDLPSLLPADSLMVFNDTRVIYARLHFRKQTGALIEVFCLEPLRPTDYQLSFAAKGEVTWTCLVGNLKRWREGLLSRDIDVAGHTVHLTAERGEAVGSGHAVTLRWDDHALTFAEILEAVGELPIPPYLNRATEQSDLKTYQTVYSRVKGSVAAPTAGLHFTPRVLEALDTSGIKRLSVTLHVGAGTFRPVKSKQMEGHEMHAEWFSVSREVISLLIDNEAQGVTAVGTTSVRTLESLFYAGLIVKENPQISPDEIQVGQWTPYEVANDLLPSTRESLQAIVDYLDAHHLSALTASTRIIICPGFRFRLVRRMVTNFHQPHSTLLLLVSAFVGEDWQRIYRHALESGYRFLSYGDSSLLLPQSTK